MLGYVDSGHEDYSKSLIGKIVPYVACTIAIGAFCGLVYWMTSSTNKLKERKAVVRQYENRIFKNFDKDKNGRLDGNEIVGLARACGYNEVFPLENPTARIRVDSDLKLKGAELCISMGDLTERRIPITENKLEELAK